MTSAQSPPCIPTQGTIPADSVVDNKLDSAEASPSDVLSQALDIVDISCGGADNEKQASSIASGRPRRSSPPITARRSGPVNATNATSSFPAKVVACHHSSMSKSTVQISSIGTHVPNQTRPKLVRLNSTDSCSTTTTVSTTASFVSSSSSTVSSTVSSPSNSPMSSPKRSIFQSYWDKKGTPSRQTNTVSFSNVPQLSSSSEDSHPAQQTQDQDEPSTLDGSTAATTRTTTKSATSGDQPSTPRSATVTLPEGCQHTASPKRSIFGNRAMERAKRSSLPDLPSIAATLITESDFSSTGASNSYTDCHRVHHVRKTSSTDHLVRVRKSCLRRVSLYSPSSTGTPGKEMKKSASAISTTATTNLQPTRPRASTLPQPVVQFDPQVRVYEFHRTVEDSHHHHNHASSNDWSHLFA